MEKGENAGKQHRAENIVEKGENAGNQHFVFFPQCSQSSKIVIVWLRVLKKTPSFFRVHRINKKKA